MSDTHNASADAQAASRGPRFAIITALGKEFAAVRSVLDEPSEPQSVNHIDLCTGRVSALDGSGDHLVPVILLRRTGSHSAAASASAVLARYPSLEYLLIVGIAGGTPHPAKPDDHVRRGDIVVSDARGVVQRRGQDPSDVAVSDRPSSDLLGAASLLQVPAPNGSHPWEAYIERVLADGQHNLRRPRQDPLYSASNPPIKLRHKGPYDRRVGQPYVHFGAIATEPKVLRDPLIRDALRDAHGVRAIEMEAVGVADATWLHESRYLVIRGISDYCDSHKNFMQEQWQAYAALAAAAYARSLIERFAAPKDEEKAAALTRAKLLLEDAYAKPAGEVDAALVAEGLAEAAALAESAGDPAIARVAHLRAARHLEMHLVESRVGRDDPVWTDAITTIDAHIASAEALGAAPGIVAVEKALRWRLGDDPELVLALCSEAEALGIDDVWQRGDVLLARIQALWQLERLPEARQLEDQVHALLNDLEAEEPRLVLSATWVRTVIKSGESCTDALRQFSELAERVDRDGREANGRLVTIIDEVVWELARRKMFAEALTLAEVQWRVATKCDAEDAVNTALTASRLAVELVDEDSTRDWLGRAESRAADERTRVPHEAGTAGQVILLLARGSALTRIGQVLASRGADAERALLDGKSALIEAHALAEARQTGLDANAQMLLVETRWWLGNSSEALGCPDEAADWFKRSRSDVAMSDTQFIAERGAPAWLAEAENLRRAGRLKEALQAATDLIKCDSLIAAAPLVAERAVAFHQYIDQRELPVVDWFGSRQATDLATAVGRTSMHEVVGSLYRPLVEWWDAWRTEEREPARAFLDFWGRGGFARVAAAVRSAPHRAIAVDATTVEEIRLWARIFCPLFDTVLVKWKGQLGAEFGMLPMQLDWGGPDAYGGWGYTVTAGTSVSDPQGEEWTIAMGWMNPVPAAIAQFLAGEARQLVLAGRLVLLPASLVGCSQSAVGWTDDLLTTGFLGGVVTAAQSTVSDADTRPQQRLVDLRKTTIPYIENVGLDELARVLAEAEDQLDPLRTLFCNSL
ncbi:MAG: hypothetical protein L6413_09885, partial [Coriobacteriia bacterium]|nr:hypothetical protein [Coriobacteriia bacterium]